jgi:hypothetical protein
MGGGCGAIPCLERGKRPLTPTLSPEYQGEGGRRQSGSGQLNALVLFGLGFIFRDDLVLDIGRHRFVVAEFHGEGALAAGDAF